MTRAAFLDRDGTIIRANVRNGRPFSITSLDEFQVLDGAAEAIQQLHDAGFLVVVVTNQPDAVTGKVSREFVAAVNARLTAALAIDAIEVCYEIDGPDAICYKPKPGMLLGAAQEHGIELARSYMVGDRWRDVGAGKAAGCRTVFIDCGYDEPLDHAPDHVVGSLREAADVILAAERA